MLPMKKAFATVVDDEGAAARLFHRVEIWAIALGAARRAVARQERKLRVSCAQPSPVARLARFG